MCTECIELYDSFRSVYNMYGMMGGEKGKIVNCMIVYAQQQQAITLFILSYVLYMVLFCWVWVGFLNFWFVFIFSL